MAYISGSDCLELFSIKKTIKWLRLQVTLERFLSRGGSIFRSGFNPLTLLVLVPTTFRQTVTVRPILRSLQSEVKQHIDCIDAYFWLKVNLKHALGRYIGLMALKGLSTPGSKVRSLHIILFNNFTRIFKKLRNPQKIEHLPPKKSRFTVVNCVRFSQCSSRYNEMSIQPWFTWENS